MSDDELLIRPAPYAPTRDDLRGRSWVVEHRVRLVAMALLIAVGWFIWFIFTAKSVELRVDPPGASIAVSGGFGIALGAVYVLREGSYVLHADADGYMPLTAPLTIGEKRNQSYSFEMTREPGRITFETSPVSIEVFVDGASIGTTPLHDVAIPAGTHRVGYRQERYQNQDATITVEGRRVQQTFSATLLPNWATITTTSEPPGASIMVDDHEVGVTPAAVEIVAGAHELRLKRSGFKTWRSRVDVTAQQDQTLPTAQLEAADGLVTIITKPAGAGVTLNGTYRGETPLEVALTPRTRYEARITRAGYDTAHRTLSVAPNEEQTVQVELAPLTGKVLITAEPKDAEIVIDGTSHGVGGQTLILPARPQKLEVRMQNYAPYTATFTPQPGLTQEINVHLLTVAEARVAALQPRRNAPNGQTLVLLSPGHFTMGSSRREPGRRANEVLREVTLTRMFYLSTTEVTNAQFKKYVPAHDSGVFEEHKLNDAEQPVARVSWIAAALYCNDLSHADHLQPFYKTDGDKVVGVNPTATGYRLPTEAEWEWAARTIPGSDAERRFPWGDNFPPPDRSGNYADRSAANLVGRVIFGYNDNQIVSAPVATFPADARGLFDMGGNVAEWVNDFYEIPGEQPQRDPTGPDSGDYHVIRGSSWMNGTITDLRVSFRDYGTDARPDLGFRIARFAE